MQERTIQFTITGLGSATDAQTLRTKLLDLDPDLKANVTDQSPPPETQDAKALSDLDPLQLIILTFTIPQGIDATISLAKRAELIPKLKDLISWATRKCKESDIRIHWNRPGHTAQPLNDSQIDEIVQALTELANNAKRN